MSGLIEAVQTVCIQVRNQTDRGTSFQSLLSKLRREFQKQHIDLYIRSLRKSKLQVEEFYVNAYYDPEDDLDNEIPIEIIIYHNFDSKTFWDKKHVTDLLIQVFDAVIHEFRHRKQSKKKNHNIFWKHSKKVESYLSDPDEIDAYALSISIELCRSIGKFRAIRYLHKPSTLSKFKIQDKYVSPNLS